MSPSAVPQKWRATITAIISAGYSARFRALTQKIQIWRNGDEIETKSEEGGKSKNVAALSDIFEYIRNLSLALALNEGIFLKTYILEKSVNKSNFNYV